MLGLGNLQSSLWDDLLAFMPELILCGGIVLLLLLRMFQGLDRLHLGSLALIVSLAVASLGINQASPNW